MHFKPEFTGDITGDGRPVHYLLTENVFKLSRGWP